MPNEIRGSARQSTKGASSSRQRHRGSIRVSAAASSVKRRVISDLLSVSQAERGIPRSRVRISAAVAVSVMVVIVVEQSAAMPPLTHRVQRRPPRHAKPRVCASRIAHHLLWRTRHSRESAARGQSGYHPRIGSSENTNRGEYSALTLALTLSRDVTVARKWRLPKYESAGNGSSVK